MKLLFCIKRRYFQICRLAFYFSVFLMETYRILNIIFLLVIGLVGFCLNSCVIIFTVIHRSQLIQPHIWFLCAMSFFNALHCFNSFTLQCVVIFFDLDEKEWFCSFQYHFYYSWNDFSLHSAFYCIPSLRDYVLSL